MGLGRQNAIFDNVFVSRNLNKMKDSSKSQFEIKMKVNYE